MGNHIFLASKENFEKCLEYGVYGGIYHPLERINSEIIVDFDARTGHNHGTKFRIRQGRWRDLYSDVRCVI